MRGRSRAFPVGFPVHCAHFQGEADSTLNDAGAKRHKQRLGEPVRDLGSQRKRAAVEKADLEVDELGRRPRARHPSRADVGVGLDRGGGDGLACPERLGERRQKRNEIDALGGTGGKIEAEVGHVVTIPSVLP